MYQACVYGQFAKGLSSKQICAGSVRLGMQAQQMPLCTQLAESYLLHAV